MFMYMLCDAVFILNFIHLKACMQVWGNVFRSLTAFCDAVVMKFYISVTTVMITLMAKLMTIVCFYNKDMTLKVFQLFCVFFSSYMKPSSLFFNLCFIFYVSIFISGFFTFFMRIEKDLTYVFKNFLWLGIF